MKLRIKKNDEAEQDNDEREVEEEAETETVVSMTAPIVRHRHCCTCGEVGHNSRTCPLRYM